METKKRNIIIISILSLILVANIVTLSRVFLDRPLLPVYQDKPFNKSARCSQEPNLSPSQQIQLRELRNIHRSQRDKLHKDMQHFRHELLLEMQTEIPDTVAINKLLEQLVKNFEAHQRANINHFYDIRAITTPQQRKAIFNNLNTPSQGRNKRPCRRINY